jgi:glutamate-1-semialdehyde 2,1-aminomutase
MSALRVARAATGRNKVLKFDGCYHGHSDPLLVKSGSGLAGEATSDSAGVSPEVAGETLVAPLDDEQALAQIFAKHGSQIAVVVIEPLPANYGLLIQRREFISKMVELAKAHGSLVLFDEVISGFRVAMGGMAEQLGMKPDLVTYGKVLGGGFPVGCYGGRRELLDLVAPAGPVYQAGTLSANPVGMRAGLATLQKMKKTNVFCELEERAQRFQENINSGMKAKGLGLRMLTYGSLFWLVESEKPIRRLSDIPSTHKEKFAKFFHACLKRGLYLAPSGFEVGFLSLAHTNEILDQAAQSMIAAAVEVGK